jgi:predicted P-loop ATPase
MTTTAAYAAAYCRRYGFALVPLPPKTKRPLSDDWGKNVITDPDAASEFFTERPTWNLGVALGPSRLCSFDVDDIDATRAIFEEFGWDLEALRAGAPTIQGRPDGFRIMFKVPDGVELDYHALTWPKRDGGGRFTVFELRAAHDQQRQDVLPPSIHPDTGNPYIWTTKPNGHIPPPPDFMLQIWKNWGALKPQLQAICPWAPKPEPKRPTKPAPAREGGSVIEKYNAAYTIEAELQRHGYTEHGKRWLSPHSGTKLPGVTVLDGNKCYIHHASDPLCSDESGQPVGPFDLYCYYDHGNDVRKAVRAAAEALGLERRPPPNAPTSAPTIDPETGEIITTPPAPPGTLPRYQAVEAYGLTCNSKGVPDASVSNIVNVLLSDKNLARKIWFDEFLDRVCTIWRSDETREWGDVDDIKLQVYLQQTLGMPRLGKQSVQDAVIMVANMDRRNEAKAYIDGITWDGTERLAAFMVDCFGAEPSEYTSAASRNFWLSLVARVLRPGCKVDTMVVLEGAQGAGKSMGLSIIGGKWFAEAHESPTSKDFFLGLAGKMLVEIGEMDAFSRSEVTKVKQVITCQTDRYRAPYERHAADHQRRCVFAGTTNRDDWNKDETGARRFWPIYCGDIRHDLIRANRDQLFAEAAAALAAGANWWDMPAEATLSQQEARRDVDSLEDDIAGWSLGRSEITTRDIMNDLMRLPIEKQDRNLQMRIAKALRSLHWVKLVAWRGSKAVRVWRKRDDATGKPECVEDFSREPF